MINANLKQDFKETINSISARFKNNKKCVAAYLIGIASYDVIWEWYDSQIVVIFDDDYKGKKLYNLLENNVFTVINVFLQSEFNQLIYLMNYILT